MHLIYGRFGQTIPRIGRIFNASLARYISVEAHDLPYTSKIEIHTPNSTAALPVYRIMDMKGNLSSSVSNSGLDKDLTIKIYRTMLTLNIMDKIMYESQRQGRISFYMTNYGEEAVQIGSAAAFLSDDFIYTQYREAGVFLWRGFGIDSMMDQCYSNKGDLHKGKQMPIHYGSKSLNLMSICSTLATQIPSAVGSAYAYKLQQKDGIVICYFGDGAASEGDAFTALNFAATLECPILFICRNNGYAISTPVKEQYKSDGIAPRALALGISSIRVDGNDVFAVYNATKFARETVAKTGRPVFMEALTYRLGHHSTSDDSTVYRVADEVQYWEKTNNPILRLRYFMFNNKWISEEEEANMKAEIKKEIMNNFAKSETKKKPNPLLLFTDVYEKMPPRLREQMLETKERIEKHSDQYNLNQFDPISLSSIE